MTELRHMTRKTGIEIRKSISKVCLNNNNKFCTNRGKRKINDTIIEELEP